MSHAKSFDIRYTKTPCKWSLNSEKPSPHTKECHAPTPKICNSVLDAIGNTPMVRVNSLCKKENIQCEVLAKCEYLNPGGSVKCRIGRRIIEDAEKTGRISPGYTLIEATAGNTGIALAMAAAVKGYKLIVTMPEKMSTEKSDTLKAFGAQVVRCPGAPFGSPESIAGVAKKLQSELPNSVILDQFSNPSNPLAHYDTTAEEILEQCDGKVDYVVVSAGTGGTLTGLSRKLKEKLPNVQIVAADPEGSIISDPENAASGPYKVEGIGYDFVPRTCNRDLVDQWIKVNDQSCFSTARNLIKHEGLMVGGTSGANMWAAIQVAKSLPAGKRVVVILPDSMRNYMTKFVNDQWMLDNGFTIEREAEPPKAESSFLCMLKSHYTHILAAGGLLSLGFVCGISAALTLKSLK